MSTINSVTNSSSIVAASEGTIITADNLLAYCAARLTSLDTMIQGRFAKQQERNETAKQAGKLNDCMNRWEYGQSAGANGARGDVTELHKDLGHDIAKLYNEATDPQLKEMIAKKYELVTGAPLPGFPGPTSPAGLDRNQVTLVTANIRAFSPEAWASANGDIKSFQDGLSKDNELQMIQLQSVVSQRQLAIQLTTQLMSSQAESKKQVIGNIR